MTLAGDPTYFNPILYTDSESGSVVGLLFNGLIKVNEDLAIVPDLAEKWETKNNGKEWIFHLKKGVLFHDGIELTADDVVYTFQKILDTTTNTVRRSDYVINGKPIAFKKIDKYTVRCVLPETFAPFLLSMGMGIIPKHLLEKENINTADFNRNPIGTGPFKFKTYKTADNVLLVRNDTYFGRKPLLAKIYFKIISEANVRLIALRKGEIDYATVPPKDFEKIKAENKVNVFVYDQLAYTYLGYNYRKPPFSDVRVRQAIAYAVDKRWLIKSIMKDLATPVYSPSHPLLWSHNDNVNKFLYSPEKAKQLLSQAGWKLSNGILKKDGKPFVFDIYMSKGSTTAEKAATKIQQDLKKMGITMNLRVLEWSSLLKIINAPKDPKGYDAVMMAWSLGLDPDSYGIWHSSEYPKGFNHNGYKNKEVDKLLVKGRQVIDQAARKKVYARIYDLIAQDQPYLFLWSPKDVAGVSRRVGGLSKPGPAGLFVNIEDVFVTK